MYTQIPLFEEPLEERLEREMNDLKEQCDKVRKGQFAKINKLEGNLKEVRAELEFLKEQICKHSPNIQPWLFK